MVAGLAVDAAGFAPVGGGGAVMRAHWLVQVLHDSQVGGGGVGGGALHRVRGWGVEVADSYFPFLLPALHLDFCVTFATRRHAVAETLLLSQSAATSLCAGTQLCLRAHLSGRSPGLPNDGSVGLPQERLSKVRLLLQHLPRLVHPTAAGRSSRG